jgi:hypothetical protein
MGQTISTIDIKKEIIDCFGKTCIENSICLDDRDSIDGGDPLFLVIQNNRIVGVKNVPNSMAETQLLIKDDDSDSDKEYEIISSKDL